MTANKWTRIASLVAASGLALAVTAYPRGLLHHEVLVDHGYLMLMMWGMSAGFVYGVGFDPNSRWLRMLFCPCIAGALLILGWGLFLRNCLL